MTKKAIPEITVSEVTKKQLKIIAYLTLSGGIGYVLATYVAKDPALTAIFAPALNFLAYVLEKELKNEGFVRALKK